MILKNINIHFIKAIVFILVVWLLASCKKMVDVDPPKNELVEETTFSKEQTATAVAVGMYRNLDLATASLNGICLSKVNSLYSDEWILTSTIPSYQEVYRNAVTPRTSSWVWDQLYSSIFRANQLLEGLEKYGQNIPAKVKEQLLGEGKFVRALCYFNLVNTYGDVPLLISTDYSKNRLAAKNPQSAVYQQIVADLLSAKDLLPDVYMEQKNLPTTKERLRATKDVATAYLSKVYLFIEDWAKAETLANEVINTSSVYSLSTSLPAVLNKNSKEAILQFGEAFTASYLYDLTVFGGPQNGGVVFNIGYLSDSVLNQFEAGDKRKTEWTATITVAGKTYPYSVKHPAALFQTQFYTDLRLAELYLIRAEARIQQNKIEPGIGDLNKLRARARAAATLTVPDPLPDLSLTLSKQQAMLALEKEWTTEMFLEGRRWFNLKRWKGINNPAISRADELMPYILANKGGTWQPYMKLFPIPEIEIQLNPNLVQNDGY